MYNRRKATGRRGLAFLLAVVMLAGCMGMTAFAEEALGETTVDEAELGGDAADAVLPEGGSPDVSEGESVGFEPVPEETVPEETAEGPELPEAEEQVVEDETGTDVDETVSFEAKSSLDEDFTGICAEGSGNYAQPDDADPSALVQGYFEKELGLIRLRGPLNPTCDMTVLQAAVYEELLQCVRETAAGERSSTVYRVAFEDPDLLTWTAEELGYPEFNSENLGAAVERIFQNELSFDIIHTALLNVCPFELYWYDKTVGVRYSFSYMIPSQRAQSFRLTDLTYTFCVASEYADGQNTERVKAGTGEAIRAAANRANSIVNDCTETNDAERLRYYRDAVCALTDYNYAAAAGGVPYGNPWQLIWVFDGNPETRVVCEGYSKAFQLLCDLTRQRGLFRASSTNCISVSGTMNGGNHMWNLVSMDDGANYLADVTNCDEGETGSDRLFLRGYEEKIGDRQYTVGGITYLYNGETVSYYPPDVLALSAADWKESYYTITMDDTDPNGRVTAPESACSQELVTLTVTPAEGYALAADGLRVTYADSDYTVHAVEVTQGTGENADRWSFIMPSAPVRITAVFTAIAHTGTWGDLSWTLDGAGKLTISGAGEMYDFNNPSDDAWRQYKADIKTVCLTAGVTSIGAYAFRGCSNLTSITVPSGVTDIGEAAFYGCSELSDIEIPAGVSCISKGAFYNCGKLASIKIPMGVTSIGEFSFEFCSSLPSVTIPASVTEIGQGAFTECTQLASVTIPYGVTSIGEGAFYDCTSLMSITIPESVTSISGWLFYGCSNLTEIVIPEGITSIGDYAFYNCSSLSNMAIPYSVTDIQAAAFLDCINLDEIRFLGAPPSIGSDAFTGVSADAFYPANQGWTSENMKNYGGDLTWIPAADDQSGSCGENLTWTLESGNLTISGTGQMPDYFGDEAPWYSERSQIVTLTVSEGVTGIGEYAFYDCCNLTSASLPEGLTGIGRYAFLNCSGLTSITIPKSAAQMSPNMFAGCTGLQSAGPIGSGSNLEFGWTEEIPACAFGNCRSLKRITIPEGITGIGAYAIADCSDLEKIVVPASVTSLGAEVFQDCTGLQSAGPIGSGCDYEFAWTEALPEGAFSGCSSLTRVSIPEGIRDIGEHAFSYCSALTEVSIPASVTSIDREAFVSCDQMNAIRVAAGSSAFSDIDGVLYDRNQKTVVRCPEGKTGSYTIPSGVTAIGDSAFLNSALTAVIIPESVEEIGYAAFFASSLADISIPTGVTYIHHECFRFCRNLTGIRMPDSIDFIGSYSFEGCESLTKITIPKAVTVIGNNAFADCIQLSEIRFRGTSPFIDSDAFDHVTATAAYPSNQGWTDEDRQDYGGTITWVQINVEAQLQEISDNSDSMNADEIRSAAQDLDRDSLKEAMETDLENNGVVASMKELDEKLGGTEVKVSPEMAGSFSPDDIDVTGAQLNTPEAADTPIKFVLDKPKNNDVVPAMYNSSVAVRFSMDLENTDTSGMLDVPVKVTLPIPAGLNPELLVVLHYHAAGSEPEAIIPYVFYENGKPYASFVLSSFSDFIFTEERTEEEISFQTTLNLADYTGIFVYIGLPEGADASAYTVEASYHSYRQNYTKGPAALNTLPKGSGARAGMYKFEPLRAASTELSDTVTVTLKKDGTVVKVEEYSVRSIAEARLAAGELSGDAATLHRALLQYGRYGQLVFNNRTDDLPGTEGAPALVSIPAAYAAKGDPTNFGAYVTKFEGKLDLNSAISMNLYLTPAKGYSRDSFQISVLDKDWNAYSKYSVTTDSSNRIRVRIEGILSPQMARNFRVVVTLKSNPAKTATWTRSVLSCAYTTEQTNANVDVKSLMQALYQYYIYAARVFPQFV